MDIFLRGNNPHDFVTKQGIHSYRQGDPVLFISAILKLSRREVKLLHIIKK